MSLNFWTLDILRLGQIVECLRQDEFVTQLTEAGKQIRRNDSTIIMDATRMPWPSGCGLLMPDGPGVEKDTYTLPKLKLSTHFEANEQPLQANQSASSRTDVDIHIPGSRQLRRPFSLSCVSQRDRLSCSRSRRGRRDYDGTCEHVAQLRAGLSTAIQSRIRYDGRHQTRKRLTFHWPLFWMISEQRMTSNHIMASVGGWVLG